MKKFFLLLALLCPLLVFGQPVYQPASTADVAAKTRNDVFLTPAQIPNIAGNSSPFVASVLTYGAKGDGVANDYPALNSAMLAVSNAGGGTIMLPDNMTFRITTPHVNGILLTNMSNVTIQGGGNTTLLMDNLIAGVSDGAGIFIAGPCSNITIRDLHVKYAQMSADREGGTYAPVYILGANVGNGSGTPAWWRGDPGGSERPDLIDAGAVHNVNIDNVWCENSPSVGLGIVGVDGIKIHNVHLKNTWADGLYHLFFRNSQVSDIYEENVGDDAISMASYESDFSNANITNAYHAEGSRVVNVFINGTYPPDGAPNANLQVPSAGIAVLGVRDVVFANISVNDKFRALRFANGLETNGPNAPFNLNFLANQNISVDGFVERNCIQNIAMDSQQSTYGEDPKWWLNKDVNISHFTGEGGLYTMAVFSDGPLNKTPIMAGYNYDHVSMTGYTQTFGTFGPFYQCTFKDMTFDGAVNFEGFIPFGGNPDAINSVTTSNLYPNQNSTMDGITAQSISCVGLKGVKLDNITVRDSISSGLVLSSSADISFGNIYVQNPAFTNSVSGVQIDAFCRRVAGKTVFLDAGTNVNVANALGINSVSNIYVSSVVAKTLQNSGYYLVADVLFNQTKVSSVGRVDWLNANQSGTPAWTEKTYGGGYQTPTTGFDYFPASQLKNQYFIEYPLLANVTAYLHEDGVKVGDTCTVSRVATSTGPYTISINGQTASTPQVFETLAIGSFIIESGNTGDTIATVKVQGTNVMGSAVAWAGDPYTTAQLVASNINYYESNSIPSPIYTAFNDSSTMVSIQNIANNNSAQFNGYTVATTTTGTILADNQRAMAGGVTPAAGSGTQTQYGPLYVFPAGQTGSATFIYGENAWHLLSSTIPDTNLVCYSLANIAATNAPANGNTLRYTNGNFYWSP